MRYALKQIDGKWVKLAAGLTISIDFDKTWSADPALWRGFVKMAKSRGHHPVMITRRDDTPKQRAEVEKSIEGVGFDELIFAGGTQKQDAARKAGVSVDVWVDDYPEGIPS
jgi:hypothetical protein